MCLRCQVQFLPQASLQSENLFSVASASSHIACLEMKLPGVRAVRFAVPIGMRFDRDERREASAAASALAAVLVP